MSEIDTTYLSQDLFTYWNIQKKSTEEIGTLTDQQIEADNKVFIVASFPRGISVKFPIQLLLNGKYELVTKKAVGQAETDKLEQEKKSLIEYIEEKQTYSMESFRDLRMSENIRYKLTKLLRESKKNHYFFREDWRPPRTQDQGLFQIGISPDDTLDNFNDGVHITANLEDALVGLDPADMDPEWNGREYLYFISPELINDIHGNFDQISCKNIPAQNIRAAIEIKSKGGDGLGSIYGIFRNKKRSRITF